MAQLNKTDVLSGADLAQIHQILTDNYGSGYVIDFGDETINQVRKGSIYTTVSFGIVQEQGTVRAILYVKNADGRWKKAEFDKAAEDPCVNSSAEDKLVLRTIGLCTEPTEAEKQAMNPEAMLSDGNGGSFDVGNKKLENEGGLEELKQAENSGAIEKKPGEDSSNGQVGQDAHGDSNGQNNQQGEQTEKDK